LGRARWSTLRHLLRPGNVALIFMRQTFGVPHFTHAWVTSSLASDRVFYSRRGAPFLAPLILADDDPQCVNLRLTWLETLQSKTRVVCSPREALAYVYGKLHSPEYRQRYAAELAQDFPRIAWPVSAEEFQYVAQIGEQLLQLHTEPQPIEVPLSWYGTVSEYGDGPIARGYPRYEQGRCWLNRHSWIEGIEPAAWHFQAGGYAMLKQWLKKRAGRRLVADDLLQFARCVRLALATTQLMHSLDNTMQS
jgi:hypothetical protein